MKLIFLTFCVAFMASLSFAQVKEGSVSYLIEMNTDDPQMQAQIAMFQGSKMSMNFNSDFSRMEFNFGMLMNTVTVINSKKKIGLMLLSGMMGSKAVKLTEKDIQSEQTEVPTEKIVITATDEMKKILGYNCKKYLITLDGEIELAYWTTTEIDAPKNKNKFMYGEVEGFALQFEASMMGLNMSFTATDFKTSLSGVDTKKLFDMSVPDGYELVTMDDLKGIGM